MGKRENEIECRGKGKRQSRSSEIGAQVLPHTVAHKPVLKRKLLASKNINEARLTATFLPLGTSVSVEGEDSPQGAQFKNYLTEWDATVSTFSTIVGAAILATPYAFTLAGAVAVRTRMNNIEY